MGAFFAKADAGSRTGSGAVELSLDLTTEAIVLYQRGARGGWKKFASAQLDDTEFPIVIGLLRNEAESDAGGRQPVRLWLPGDQILKRRTQIPDGKPASRLKAAFEYVERQTVYRPQDVAVAVAPTSRDGKTTLLITFAETWREARDYATRWGFQPGTVSTRHHSGDFGADGPVFELQSPPRDLIAPAQRKKVSALALVLVAVAAGTGLWALKPWAPSSVTGEPGPQAPVQVAEAPAASDAATVVTPEAPEPAAEETVELKTAPADSPQAKIAVEPLPAPLPMPALEALVDARSPPGFEPPLLASVDPVVDMPRLGFEPLRVEPLVEPDILEGVSGLGNVPTELSALEPAPLERDPVTAWTGPIPGLEPVEPIAPTVTRPAVDDAAVRIADVQVASLPASYQPFSAPAGLPNVDPPVTEQPPVEQAPVTAAVIAPAVDVPEDLGAEVTLTEPIQAEIGVADTSTPEIVTPEGVEPELAALSPTEDALPEDEADDAVEVSAIAPENGPVPTPRPANSVPEQAAPVPQMVAMIMPPPRPRNIERAQTDAEPRVVVATTEALEVAVAPEITAVPEGTADPQAGIAPLTPAMQEATETKDPEAATRYASLTSPVPPTRPAVPIALPSVSVIKPLTGQAHRSISSAATEPGLPLDRATLIGILNLDAGRKALLRLPNGRYRSVSVGDVLDGWRVSLIGADAMRFTRSGEDRTLLLVNR